MELQVNTSFRDTLTLRQQLLPHLHMAVEIAKTQGTSIVSQSTPAITPKGKLKHTNFPHMSMTFTSQYLIFFGMTGAPIARPMWFITPTSPGTAAVDDQYMLGDNLVIAPILYPNATTRSVVLPSGVWRLCDELPSRRDYHAVTVLSCVPSSALYSFTHTSNTTSTNTNSSTDTMVLTILGPATCKIANATLTSMPPCFVTHTT